jgi:hypothetical protein
VVVNVGIFAGAMLGGYLTTHLPARAPGFSLEWEFALVGEFAVSAFVRLLTVRIFLPWLREVRQVRPLCVSGLTFRATRIHARPVFDMVGARGRGR